MCKYSVLFIACMVYVSSERDMLIVVNYQNDFQIGGAMGKPENEENRKNQSFINSHLPLLIDLFKDDEIVVSQENHPKDHISFFSFHKRINQGRSGVSAYLGDHFDPNDIKSLEVLYEKDSLNFDFTPGDRYVINGYFYTKREYFDPDTEVPVRQNLFPDHCIKQTFGVELQEDVHQALNKVLDKSKVIPVFELGSAKGMDDLSLVQNTAGEEHKKFLKIITHDINRIFLTGVFMEYVVINTALDLLHRFPDKQIYIVQDLTLSFLEKSLAVNTIKENHPDITFISFQQIQLQKK